jgi:hypothetical protein
MRYYRNSVSWRNRLRGGVRGYGNLALVYTGIVINRAFSPKMEAGADSWGVAPQALTYGPMLLQRTLLQGQRPVLIIAWGNAPENAESEQGLKARANVPIRSILSRLPGFSIQSQT